MAIVQTLTVTLQDGTEAVINASDFDPALHTVAGTTKKKSTKKKSSRGAT